MVAKNIRRFQEINSFGWYNDTVNNSSITTKHLYLILTFRSHHEIFIRRSWYSKTTVIDREQDHPTRWIKEAVHIRKEGHQAMKRDEGSYQLSHATTAFLKN